jgi:hypothetical protein
MTLAFRAITILSCALSSLLPVGARATDALIAVPGISHEPSASRKESEIFYARAQEIQERMAGIYPGTAPELARRNSNQSTILWYGSFGNDRQLQNMKGHIYPPSDDINAVFRNARKASSIVQVAFEAYMSRAGESPEAKAKNKFRYLADAFEKCIGVKSPEDAPNPVCKNVVRWAKYLKSQEIPVYLRPMSEMNLDPEFTEDPDAYAAAWNHIHRIFHEVGAKNVKFVFAPFVGPGGTGVDGKKEAAIRHVLKTIKLDATGLDPYARPLDSEMDKPPEQRLIEPFSKVAGRLIAIYKSIPEVEKLPVIVAETGVSRLPFSQNMITMARIKPNLRSLARAYVDLSETRKSINKHSRHLKRTQDLLKQAPDQPPLIREMRERVQERIRVLRAKISWHQNRESETLKKIENTLPKFNQSLCASFIQRFTQLEKRLGTYDYAAEAASKRQIKEGGACAVMERRMERISADLERKALASEPPTEKKPESTENVLSPAEELRSFKAHVAEFKLMKAELALLPRFLDPADPLFHKWDEKRRNWIKGAWDYASAPDSPIRGMTFFDGPSSDWATTNGSMAREALETGAKKFNRLRP